MSHYLPVLIVSVAAGIPDDASFQPLPSGQVDYLSHEWQEEDVWRSWRNMTKQKNEIANGVRLENASWRTWWKQRNNLKTVSPETLNWLKDSDVTWLYGPLHTATEWTPPTKSERSRQDSLSSPSSSSNLDQLALQASENTDYITPTNHQHHQPYTSHTYGHSYSHSQHPYMTKPILKHRTISEMLTSALVPGSGLYASGSGSGNLSGGSGEIREIREESDEERGIEEERREFSDGFEEEREDDGYPYSHRYEDKVRRLPLNEEEEDSWYEHGEGLDPSSASVFTSHRIHSSHPSHPTDSSHPSDPSTAIALSSSAPTRPPLMHTKSDTNILKRFGAGAQPLRRKQAPEAVLRVAHGARRGVEMADESTSSTPAYTKPEDENGDIKIVRADSTSPNPKSPTGSTRSDSGSLSNVQRTSSSSNLVDMPIMQQLQAVQSSATGFLPVMHVDRDAFAPALSLQTQNNDSDAPQLSLPGILGPMPRRYQGYGGSLSAGADDSALRSNSLSGSSGGSSRSDSVEPTSRSGSRTAYRGSSYGRGVSVNGSGPGRRFSESTVQPGSLVQSQRRPEDGQSQSQAAQGTQRRHITFNPYVEQCIALDVPKVKTRGVDQYGHVYGGYGGYSGYGGYPGYGGYASGSNSPVDAESVNGNGNMLFDHDGAEMEHKEERAYGFEDDEDGETEDVDAGVNGVDGVDDGYDQDEEDGLFEDINVDGHRNGRSTPGGPGERKLSKGGMEHGDADDENEKDDEDEEDEEDDDLIQMKIRPAIARRYSASAIGIPRLSKNDSNDGSVRMNGRPMLRRTATANSVTISDHRGASHGRRSVSSEKEPVSIAYIAPTTLKPGVSGKGSMYDDDDDDDDDDDEIFARIGVEGFEGEGGVDPSVTMYADGPYSYVYGASYSPGSSGSRYSSSSERDLQQHFAQGLGNSQGGTTYHTLPDGDRMFSPPIVGSPGTISYNGSSENLKVPEEHYFERQDYMRSNAGNTPGLRASSASSTSGSGTQRPHKAVLAEGGTIETVDDINDESSKDVLLYANGGSENSRRRSSADSDDVPIVSAQAISQSPSSPVFDRRTGMPKTAATTYASAFTPEARRSTSLSPDSLPPTNPRVASLKNELGYKQPASGPSTSAFLSSDLPTPTLAIPTPAISPSHQQAIPSSPDAQDSTYLSPPDLSPSRTRGRSQCVSPINGGYVTSGSATSNTSAFSTDSRSLSESRSESRGRSVTRGSSCSDPDRFNSRSRSSGGTGSPIGSVSPNSKAVGKKYGYAGATAYGAHSGREIRDGKGNGLYRKTSEDSIGSRERGREKSKRVSESLSPPDTRYNNGGRHRAQPATVSSPPPTRNHSSSLLYQSYTVNNFGGSPRSTTDVQNKNLPVSSISGQSSNTWNAADYPEGANPSSQSTVSGFVSRSVPLSIPEEDEARSPLGSPTASLHEKSLKGEIQSTAINSPPATPSAKPPKYPRPQTLPSPTVSTPLPSPSIQSRSPSMSSQSSPADNIPSTPFSATQEEVGSSSFVGRAADIVTSARGFLGSLWN